VLVCVRLFICSSTCLYILSVNIYLGVMYIARKDGSKTSRIRDFLLELIEKGELDLSKPVPNEKIREWAQALKDKYNEDFNFNTISNVIHELRVAKYDKIDELDEDKGESKDVVDEDKPKGGGVWKIVVGVIVGIVVIGAGFMLLTGRVGSLLGKKKQGVNTNVNTPISS